MRPLTQISGTVAPLVKDNIDTDMIIPKQFLKSIKRTGFGVNLFDEWRYLDEGQPGQSVSDREINHSFILNQAPFSSAKILLTGANFGCGSSREHAPWALADFGFQVVIAESFADIFYNNCFKNSILPIKLNRKTIDQWKEVIEAEPDTSMTVDLVHQTILLADEKYPFEIDEARKNCLLKGEDEIDLTLKYADLIRDYEKNRAEVEPWVFG